MEALLKNLDVRVGRIEQILPTLAARTDLERFATKADLERFATKADLEGVERHLSVLFEHLSGSVDTLALHLSDQMERLSDLIERLDRGRQTGGPYEVG